MHTTYHPLLLSASATPPLALILAVLLWKYADRKPEVAMLHAWLSRIGCAIVLALGIASVWMGRLGVRRAKEEHAAPILPMTGMLFSLLALFLWIIAAIGLINTTESLLRNSL